MKSNGLRQWFFSKTCAGFSLQHLSHPIFWDRNLQMGFRRTWAVLPTMGYTLDPNGLFGYFHLAPALDFEVFAELNRGESAISPSPQTTVSWGKSRIKRWIFFSNVSGQTQLFVWRVSLPEVLFPMSTTVMHVARQDARSGDVRLLGICWDNVVANIVNVRPDVAYSNGHRWGSFQPLVQT